MTMVLFQAGCGPAPRSLPVLLENATGWQVQEVSAGRFLLAQARRGEGPVRRIYIEGDGRALITATQPSGNPTPLNPAALQLAMADPLQPVMYLARPCQFARNKACADVRVWTEFRFTEEVAAAYAELIAQETQGAPVELVGYSGGAWVALQVAARLPNVTAVRTVAGNVDPAYVNQLHKAAPMQIAPWPEVSRLADIPQVHYAGMQDAIVPPQVAERAVATHMCARVVKVEADHHKGWAEQWPALVHEPLPVCSRFALRD